MIIRPENTNLLGFCLTFAAILVSGPSLKAFSLHGNKTGNFTPKMHSDTLIIKYTLQFRYTSYDSVKLHTVPNIKDLDAEAGSRADAVKLEQVTLSEADTTQASKWAGRFQLCGYEHGIPEQFVLLMYNTINDTIPNSVTVSDETLVFYPAGKGARFVNMGISFATRRDFPDDVQSDVYLPAWRLEDHFGRLTRHSTIWLGYSINHSGTFSLYDYAKLEYESVPWTRESGLPMPGVAISYSRVKARRDGVEFIEKGLAAEFSIKIEGPFESFRYAYNTIAGGYHRADIMFSLIGGSPGTGKFGTMYSFYRGKHVNMMSLSIYMGGGFFPMLERRNNRHFFHNALASVALIPLLPVALLMGLAE